MPTVEIEQDFECQIKAKDIIVSTSSRTDSFTISCGHLTGAQVATLVWLANHDGETDIYCEFSLTPPV